MEPPARRAVEAADGRRRGAGRRRAEDAGTGHEGRQGRRPMSLTGTVWTPIGPSPIDEGAILANGQVTAIAVHPNNPAIIYIGTMWGGVWRTRDTGATWTPVFD